MVESQDAPQQGGERRLVMGLHDLTSGRRTLLSLAFDRLAVRRLEVIGR
jgi:hypothetical protein